MRLTDVGELMASFDVDPDRTDPEAQSFRVWCHAQLLAHGYNRRYVRRGNPKAPATLAFYRQEAWPEDAEWDEPYDPNCYWTALMTDFV